MTLAKWEGLSPKVKWDILTAALRGPDQRNHTIKWFTTSVLRHHLEDVLISIIGKSAGGMVNKYLPFVVLPSMARSFKEKGLKGEYKETRVKCERCEGRGKIGADPTEPCPFCEDGFITYSQYIVPEPAYSSLSWFDINHFTNHIAEGAMFMGVSVVNVPFEAWCKAMETDSVPEATKILIEACKGQDEVVEELRKHLGKMGGW